VMISSNIGPEIILAWSIFGIIYTAIGVAHTLYAPPKKWIPRIVILGLAIGFAVSTALWALVVVVLSLVLMVYLAPGRRAAVFAVMLSACSIALFVTMFFLWAMGLGPGSVWLNPKPTLAVVQNLGFVFADGLLLVVFSIAAMTAYGSWPRTRYFGNTAPLLTAFTVVLLFALVPSLYIWYPVLGLCFIFLFIAGVAADFLETRIHRPITAFLVAGLLLRIVLGLRTLWVHWIGQNGV